MASNSSLWQQESQMMILYLDWLKILTRNRKDLLDDLVEFAEGYKDENQPDCVVE
jgi:hypothetical protein